MGTDDFIDWAGSSTSRLFYCHIEQLHAYPQDWLKTLMTTYYFDVDSDTIFRVKVSGTEKDITDVKTKDIYLCSLVT